jgi:hypothetical protein
MTNVPAYYDTESSTAAQYFIVNALVVKQTGYK